MEIIQGKHTRVITALELAGMLSGYRDILVDLGTGDGRFILSAARQQPGLFAIGVDACRENLRGVTCAAPANTLFAIANVTAAGCSLPAEIHGLAARVTINVPWGSLRDALLSGEDALLESLRAIMRPGARLEVRLNASALAEAGWELADAGGQLAHFLAGAGFQVRSPQPLTAGDLRAIPSTWAKRLAFGRRPEAVYISALSTEDRRQ